MSFTEPHLCLMLAAPLCAMLAVRMALAQAGGGAHIISERSTALISAASAFGVVLCAATAPDVISGLFGAVLAIALVFLTAFDIAVLAIPVLPVAAFIALGLAGAAWTGGSNGFLLHTGAALGGFAAFRLLDMAYQRLRGLSGLGEGDAWVAALIGAFLGVEALAWSIAIGGAALLLWRVATAKGRDQPFALVPGLALGAFAVVLVQNFSGAL